jgi:hypothetical protein
MSGPKLEASVVIALRAYGLYLAAKRAFYAARDRFDLQPSETTSRSYAEAMEVLRVAKISLDAAIENEIERERHEAAGIRKALVIRPDQRSACLAQALANEERALLCSRDQPALKKLFEQNAELFRLVADVPRESIARGI